MERFLKSRYRIGEKLSENPFSVTYKGAIVDTNKPVVIKIYKRGTLNSALINRMKSKVKEFSFLNHHGIAKLIDGDYGWQGFYYVREFIDGYNLQQVLEGREEIGAEKAAAIAIEVCGALEAAHNKEIVHGALKPGNIFIDGGGIVKVADFVIEGEIKEAMPQKVLMIMDDGQYISPEELEGMPASNRSDIYALGVILLELAVSQKVPIKNGLGGALQKLKSSSVADPEMTARLPRYLQDIIARALQPDPLLRFASIADLRESLESRSLVIKPPPYEEYAAIFENTVTQYGGEGIDKESESLEDLGRVRIRWGKEKHRNWILMALVVLAVLAGILYALLVGI